MKWKTRYIPILALVGHIFLLSMHRTQGFHLNIRGLSIPSKKTIRPRSFSTFSHVQTIRQSFMRFSIPAMMIGFLGPMTRGSEVSGTQFGIYQSMRLFSTRKTVYYPANSGDRTLEQAEEDRLHGENLLTFLNSSPEPFHCVQMLSEQMDKEGFAMLDEDEPWRQIIKPGGKYYFTRNKSSIVAFIVGKDYVPGNAFKVIGAHTDSPNLKIKPNSKRSASGVCQINVECYGGGIWSSWFDRELSVAGRVIVRDPSTGKLESRLLRIDRPLLRIPSLCIHLRTPDERENMKINKEDHLMPILCDEVKKQLSSTARNDTEVDKDYWRDGQSVELLEVLSEELGVKSDQIVDFELSLFDTQPACVTGWRKEYIAGARIDNLASCYVATRSFMDSSRDSTTSDGLVQGNEVNMIALFDHEEVGSESQPGAGSTLMGVALSRTCRALHYHQLKETIDEELIQITLSKSFVISSDMAHAVHPNYAAKHDKNHAPLMNSGIVIKSNANQRYATNGMTGLIIRELGRRAGVPVQEFAVRNDCPCGSTIGPIISSNTGIRAVDIGMPQLSMHSIREMMGVSDLTFGYRLFREFYENFSAVDKSIN